MKSPMVGYGRISAGRNDYTVLHTRYHNIGNYMLNNKRNHFYQSSF